MVKREFMRGNPWGRRLHGAYQSERAGVAAPSLFLRSGFSGRPAHLKQTFDTLAYGEGVLRPIPKSQRHRLVALVPCAHRDEYWDPLFTRIDDLSFKPFRPVVEHRP